MSQESVKEKQKFLLLFPVSPFISLLLINGFQWHFCHSYSSFQVIYFVVTSAIKGTVHKWCHAWKRGKGLGKSWQFVTRAGRGVTRRVTSHILVKINVLLSPRMRVISKCQCTRCTNTYLLHGRRKHNCKKFQLISILWMCI